MKVSLSLVCSVFLLAGCATPIHHVAGPVFRDGASTDLVVRFNGWQYVNVTQPREEDGDFLRMYDRTGLTQVLPTIPHPHGLAVVICGFQFTPQQQAKQQAQWSELLRPLGYHRVVFVQADGSASVDGMPILRSLDLEAQNTATIQTADRR